MYKKEKLVLVVIAIIISSTIMITSLVFGIIQIANSKYDDLYTFTVKLAGQKTDSACGNFIAKKNEHLSFWIKIPDRRVENKDFQLSVNITDFNRAIDTTWKNDFRFGSWRNGTEEGQYYHLGTYDFKSSFNGTLCYKTSGNWIAPYNAALVIRRKARFKMPWRDFKFFNLGLLLFALGLSTFLKNKNFTD
ncbi:MAG: hypothetical protein KJ915_01425 [Candidatus Omnitrophica bacterium]|nr:hypothetical protein [Candidatus Omnitrophota bacterium]